MSSDENPPSELAVTTDGDSVLVRIAESTGYQTDTVDLRLGSTGAWGNAFHLTDIPHGPITDVSGLAFLLTDGTNTVLEFELFTVSAGYLSVRAYHGRVQLGEAGTRLALIIFERSREKSETRVEEFRSYDWSVEHTYARIFASLHDEELQEQPMVSHQSHGYVDALGRRQGVWTLKSGDGTRLLESTWKDGRPHGPYIKLHRNGTMRSLGSFENGRLNGDYYYWREDGTISHHYRFRQGRPSASFDSYHPNGRKEFENRPGIGGDVGTRRHWDAEGNLIEETDALTFDMEGG